MKIVCALLVVVLLVHLECIGSCLAESAQPPCHQHQSQHDANSSCSDKPLVDANSAAAGKCTLELADMLSVLAGAQTFNEVTLPQLVANHLPGISDRTAATLVLRI